MTIKQHLLNIWNDEICEHTNRKAQRRIVKANRLWHKGGVVNKLMAIIIHNHNVSKYNCEVYPQARIGAGLYIPHCVGVVVGNTTVLGRNCTIFPNVVFGDRYSPNKKESKGRRHALVGDNCTFGANSSIIGNITIGNNVIVGAGAVITKDIPDNCIVIGNNIIIER